MKKWTPTCLLLMVAGLALATLNLNAADVTGDRLDIGVSHVLTGTRASIAGGNANTNTGNFSTIAGGYHNRITSSNSFIGGGLHNYAWDYNGTIGGGSYNTVALLATISGGGGNTALGEYATIGGGINNSASGQSCTVAGGEYNSALAEWSTIGGGTTNRIIGGADWAVIAGGRGNAINIADLVMGMYATIGGGHENDARGYASVIPGGEQARTDKHGQFAYASGAFSQTGDAQTSTFVARRTTTDATQTELFLDGTGNRMFIESGSTWVFEGQVVGRSSGGASAGYRFRGVIDNNAGTTSMVSPPTVEVIAEDVGAWDVAIEADNTNDALVIKVTGAASTNIRWVATVQTTEVKY